MQLGKKVVVITGAARGLGRAMALAFAARGAEIAALDRDGAALGETVAQCAASGVRAKGYVTDVTSEPDVIRCFDAVVADFSRFDVLVNNAGITRDALLVKAQDGAIHSKMSLAQWQAVVDVNLTGVFLCGREGAERMIQRGHGGLIVNISSISREGNPGQTNYSAAKAGVAAMTVVLGQGTRALRHPCRGDRAGVLRDGDPLGDEAGDGRTGQGGRSPAPARRAGGNRGDGRVHRRERLCDRSGVRGGRRLEALVRPSL